MDCTYTHILIVLGELCVPPQPINVYAVPARKLCSMPKRFWGSSIGDRLDPKMDFTRRRRVSFSLFFSLSLSFPQFCPIRNFIIHALRCVAAASVCLCQPAFTSAPLFVLKDYYSRAWKRKRRSRVRDEIGVWAPRKSCHEYTLHSKNRPPKKTRTIEAIDSRTTYYIAVNIHERWTALE